MAVSKKPISVIILAAGKGTRMKSDLPKVLHKVAGKPMLNHVIDTAKTLAAKKIVVVVAPNSKEVKLAAGKAEIAIQKTQLGTGDAAKAAASNFKNFEGDVVILAGDSPLITPETLQNLTANIKNNQIHILGFEPKDSAKYGRLVTKGNEVLEIVEFKDATEKQKKITLCNSGIYALNAKLLFKLLDEVKNKNLQKEYYLTDIVKIANAKKIKTFYHIADATEVLGVNDKNELAEAECVMQSRLKKKALTDGVTMISPETIFIQADTKFGKDITLLPFVVIGEDVEIGDNVQIGPFAHIRPHTKIKAGAKIGNFVEIKKSIIGKNSKVSHLSYIGDSTLGDDVNIGAGTITCNYDGFDKFQTLIEDGVFVGSNSALVAPVKIGKGAIIGAGSTITKDVPPDSLGVARETQKNLADWARNFRKKKNRKV